MIRAQTSGIVARATRGWVGFVVRFAPWVVIAGVVLTLASGWYAAGHLGVNTNTADMISPHLQWRQAFASYREAFPQLDHNLIIVIDAPDADQGDAMRDGLAAVMRERPDLYEDVFAPGSDEFFRQNGLLYLTTGELHELSDQLALAQPILARLNADPTMAGLFDLLGTALQQPDQVNGVDLDPLLERIATVVESVQHDRADALSWQALMQGASEAPVRHVIVVKPRLDFSTLQPARIAIDDIHAAAATINAGLVERVVVRLTGPVALEYEELKTVTRGAKQAGAMALVLVLAILLFAFRSVWLVAAALFTLIAGLAVTAFFASVAVGALNLISVAFAVLYIGLGIDFAIHYTLRVREQMVQGVQREKALTDSAGDVGASLTLCAITTSVGFFAFFPTTFRGVSELGLISGTGMYISLFMSLTLLPALLRLLPLRFVSAASQTAGVMQQYSAHRALWPLVTIVTIASLFTLPFVRFDSDPLLLRDPGSVSVATFYDLLADPLYAPRALSVVAADDADAKELGTLLAGLPQTGALRTLAGFVPENQATKLVLIDEMVWLLGPDLQRSTKPDTSLDRARRSAQQLLVELKKLPTDRRAATRLVAALTAVGDKAAAQPQSAVWQTLDRSLVGTLPAKLAGLRDSLDARQVSIETLPESLRRRWLTADGRPRIEIEPAADHAGSEQRSGFVDAVRNIAPMATGLAVVQVEAGRAVVGAFRQAFITALLLIGLILILLLRDLRQVAIVLIPLLGAGLYTTAAMVAIGIPFNFANVIALPLLLGVGVDNGIHMVTRWRLQQGALLGSSTARAVLFSSLTTIASFGNLAFSDHPGSASMGTVLAIGMVATTLCSLLLVPALLEKTRP